GTRIRFQVIRSSGAIALPHFAQPDASHSALHTRLYCGLLRTRSYPRRQIARCFSSLRPEKTPVWVGRLPVTVAGSAGDSDTSSGILRAFPVDHPAAPECPPPGTGVSALTTP